MRSICTFTLLAALAAAGEDPASIRYRDCALEPALAEAKASERLVLVVLAMDG